MKPTIKLEMPPSESNALDLFRQLGEHNKSKYVHYQNANPFIFSLQVENEMVGGIAGQIWLGVLRIERLFLQKQFRAQGYGTLLLNKAEELGKESHATFSSTETLSFQNSLNFYLKHGYNIVLQEEGYEQGIKMIHLRKSLVTE